MAELYATPRFGELYHASRNAPMSSVGLAAKYLIDLFTRHGVPFAFLGGWAIHLRGNTRTTEDVDIAVNTDMAGLKEILCTEPRVCIPLTHGTTCIQIFIHTGGPWDPSYPHTTPLSISADIIINGHLNTPPELPLGTDLIIPPPHTVGYQNHNHTGHPNPQTAIPVIDIFYQLNAKLHAHTSRRTTGSTKDYVDLVFLIRTYGTQIRAFHQYLDYEARESFMMDVAVARPEDEDFTTFVKTVLGL